MSLVGHWEEAKFPAGINLVQTMAPGWRQIVSEVALDLITIPVVSALPQAALSSGDKQLRWLTPPPTPRTPTLHSIAR